jgi:transcriptional regulator
VKDLGNNDAFCTMLDSFKTDRDEAVEKLTLINPFDSEKIRDLQNTIYLCDEINARLSIFLQDGDIAQHELEQDYHDRLDP